MQASELCGVIAAIVTPFDAHDDLDEAALRRITGYVIDGGVNGIMTTGGTGEGPHLSRQERRAVARIVAEESQGRALVIAGTAACSTREALELTRDAAEAGAKAAILTPPFYFHLPGKAIYDHFATIARESPISIIVYNNPLYTGNDLSPSLLAEILNIDNIIGLKQSSSDLGQLVEVIRRAGDRSSICTGIDSQFYASLCVGAKGIFSTAACVIPREMAAIYKAFCAGYHHTALETHRRVQVLNRYFEYDPGYVAPCKEALEMLGLPAGAARKPLPALTNEERSGVRAALRELGYQL